MQYNIELCKGIKLVNNNLYELGLEFLEKASNIFNDKKSELYFYRSISIIQKNFFYSPLTNFDEVTNLLNNVY